jgi:hypothetical protein
MYKSFVRQGGLLSADHTSQKTRHFFTKKMLILNLTLYFAHSAGTHSFNVNSGGTHFCHYTLKQRFLTGRLQIILRSL